LSEFVEQKPDVCRLDFLSIAWISIAPGAHEVRRNYLDGGSDPGSGQSPEVRGALQNQCSRLRFGVVKPGAQRKLKLRLQITPGRNDIFAFLTTEPNGLELP
jgi:hypothetical protein